MEFKDSGCQVKHPVAALIFFYSALLLPLARPAYAQDPSGGLSITTQGMDDSNNNFPYSNTLNASGGAPPYTWAIVSGVLPRGLQLSASGTVSGVPKDRIKTYTVGFKVTDSAKHSASKKISFHNVYGFRTIPVPATSFGMTIYGLDNVYPSVPIGFLGKADFTTWPDLEAVEGEFDWKRLDEVVAVAQSHGLPTDWTTAYVPKWATADPNSCHNQGCTSTVKASKMPEFDAFLNALVQRYQGRITMYELWNEPNSKNVFTGTVAQMVTLTKHIYKAVRANDPAALIASPSATDANYLLDYFKQGGPKGVDLIDIHGYPDVVSNDVPEAIVGLRTVDTKINLASIGLQRKPIWDSENSWGGPRANHDPDVRASFVARSLLEHWSVGIPQASWYGWDEPVWGTLWTPSGGITPAGTAYGVVEGWMVGAAMPYPCTENGGTVWKAVYTCDFNRSGGYQARAVFDTTQTCKNGVCTTSSYTPDTKYIQYRDITGAVFPISPPGETLKIGLKPILLENMNPP